MKSPSRRNKLKGNDEDAEKEAEAAAEESLDRDLADATREAEAGQDELAIENSDAT